MEMSQKGEGKKQQTAIRAVCCWRADLAYISLHQRRKNRQLAFPIKRKEGALGFNLGDLTHLMNEETMHLSAQ